MWHGVFNDVSSEEDPDAMPYVESDYIGTLLRDATASHLLETLIQHAPEQVMGTLWNTYIAGKIGRLVIHPVANFIVAAGFARLEGDRFVTSIQEMSKVVSKCLSKSIWIYLAQLNRYQNCNELVLLLLWSRELLS